MRRLRIGATFAFAALLSGGAHAQPLFFGEAPQDVAAADLNGDGLVDFATANAFDDRVAVLVQQPGGGLSNGWSGEVGILPSHPANFPRAVEAHDWNGDGFPDLTVLCSGSFLFSAQPSIQTLLNRGDGTFVQLAADPVSPTTPVSDLFPVHFALGEFTGDGYLDAAVAQSRNFSVRILTGNGTGRFVSGPLLALPVDSDGPENVAVEDVNSDGLADLLCTSPDSFELLVQGPAGTFAAPVTVSLPVSPVDLRAATAGDFDADGSLDVALADAQGRVIVLHGFAADGSWQGSDILTDAALSEPVDIVSLQWDGDSVPDLAVADFAGGGVTVFGSIATDRFAVAPLTRRLAAADLGGDMRSDLFAICQGDTLDSGNPDGLAILDPHSSVGGGTATLDSTAALGADAGVRISGARALAASNPTRVWTVDPDRSTIREFNPSPNLNSAPASRIGRTLTFGFQVGGIWFSGLNDGYLIERDAPTVRTFHATNGLLASVSLSASPDAFGFTGFARNDSNGELYASCGATGLLMRFSSAGALLASTTVDPPAWDIDWDGSRSRLVAANPGRDSVRFFTDALAEDAALGFDLSTAPALIAGRGITGISKSRNLDDLFLLLDSGLIVRREMATGTLKDIITIDPAAEGAAVAYDPAGDLVLLMGRDGHVLSYLRSEPSQTKVVELLDVLAADSQFLFGGLAFDPVADELLVADARRPLLARFSQDSGAFLGLVDHASNLPATTWTGGVARDPVTGRTLLRSRFAVHDPDALESWPLPAGQPDIALRDGLLATRLAGTPDMLAFDLSNPSVLALVALPPGASDNGGLAFDGDGSLVAFDGGTGTGVLDDISIDIDDPSTVVDWRLFD